MIAALFVARGGVYFGLPDVDPWDEERDARTYAGPWPVVAHPPCARWGARWWTARHLGKGLGDDDGCFLKALVAVKAWGGVLEHPAGSRAWAAFGLDRPRRSGGWSVADTWWGHTGWTCAVSQRNYGHLALKWTWLYYVGAAPPPALDWSAPTPPTAWCSTDRPMSELRAMGVQLLGKREKAATPPEFRDLLLSLARGAR